MKTLPEQLACAKRELALRHSAYPGWVKSGRMKEVDSIHEIECMTCIVMTLEKMQMLAEVTEEMKAKFRAEVPASGLVVGKCNPLKVCACCGAEFSGIGQHCENCTDTPANVAQADLI